MEQLVFQVQEFQGPLDLLLQLITTHKMDIYDIPIRDILAQYLAQIQRMQEQNLAVSSDFLEMAARLIYIKSAQMRPRTTRGGDAGSRLLGNCWSIGRCSRPPPGFPGTTAAPPCRCGRWNSLPLI